MYGQLLPGTRYQAPLAGTHYRLGPTAHCLWLSPFSFCLGFWLLPFLAFTFQLLLCLSAFTFSFASLLYQVSCMAYRYPLQATAHCLPVLPFGFCLLAFPFGFCLSAFTFWLLGMLPTTGYWLLPTWYDTMSHCFLVLFWFLCLD